MNNELLKIDLTYEKITEESIPDEILDNFLGGRGLGVKLFTDNVPKKIDPLSKKNPLIFSIGPITSLNVPTSGRSSLTTKSPLTNTIFSSNTGGFWGPFLKKCGYDCVLLTGKLSPSQKSYIVIDGKEGVVIKDAQELWGLTTKKTVDKLKDIEGKNCQILCIGPAGENLVKMAAIMNQAHRAFGRGGVGAVMGSKGIKAIVVKEGSKKFPVQDDNHLKKISRVAIDKIRVVPITSQGLALFGTSVLIKVINFFGMLPVDNNQKAYVADDNKVHLISGELLREKFLEKEEGCYNCIIRCGRLTQTGEMNGKGPEYESLWALGPQLGIFDLKTITHTNFLCNDYGLDTISVGATISCAMELSQKGLIEESYLKFGNTNILCNLVKDIALRKGLGDELAEGSLKFSKKYNAEKYSMQVKGLEIPAYDPRGAMGHALNYAVSNRGACHLTGFLASLEVLGAPKKVDRFSLGGKADQLFLKQNQSAVEDSLVVCKFVGYALGFDFQVRFLQAIIGKEISITDLMKIGERIFNLERLFNLREGFSRKDDTLPERFLKEPLMEGPSRGIVVPLDKLLDDYYNVRGWDENGIPTKELLEKLSLTTLD